MLLGVTHATLRQKHLILRVSPWMVFTTKHGGVNHDSMVTVQSLESDDIIHPRYSRAGWIGVDLDGTLAHSGPTTCPSGIGEPVPLMLRRVHHWISSGRTVKIFTARADDPQDVAFIHAWCVRQGLPELEITNKKDHRMLVLWDDRAVGVVQNRGLPILPKTDSIWQHLKLRLHSLLGLVRITGSFFKRPPTWGDS